MTLTLHHGAHTQYQQHVGLCLTDDIRSACSYAEQGTSGEVATVELDTDALTVVAVAGYDRDTNVAEGDRGHDGAADVLLYTDEDINGRQHQTWRLVSQRALDRLVTVTLLAPDNASDTYY